MNSIFEISRYFRKDSSLSFWHLPVTSNSEVNFTKGKLDRYYIDFSRKLDYEAYFDDKGVPILNYYGNIGKKYNPTAIAQYGLGALQLYMQTNNIKYKNILINQADWLIENFKIRNSDAGVWEYDYASETYNLDSKLWVSAIAQGLGISLLVRVYVLTGDSKYLDGASKAFKAFRYHVNEGGVINYDASGNLFLEEVPTKKVSGILDGFLFAIFGVYDYYVITGDADAHELFESSVNTLSNRLHDYDMRFWSRADLYIDKPKMIASTFYHKLHVSQLKALYEITGKEFIKSYSEKWDKCYNNIFYRYLAIGYKAYFKIFYY
ncbi:MAG: D-glucuronyl C5-epimerase family protein [Clostridia bacterium]|nr:D-glucuronyl C5-epimerase family protein [Clostridia bacterium]